MDGGKDSSGDMNTQNAGAAMNNATSTPVQPIATPDPSSNNQIISSSGLPTATPLNAPLPTDPLHPTQAIGSGSGDIWVGGGNRNKKLLIIGIGLLAVAVVTLIIIVMLTRSGESGAVRRAETAFLEYANFVLHGKASTEKLDDACAQNDSCYFTQTLQNEVQFNAFFTESAKSRETLSKAVSAWNDKISTENEEVGGDESNSAEIIREIQDLLELSEFIRIYSSRNILKKSDIIDYYLQNGAAGIQDYIDNYYGEGFGDNTYLDGLRGDITAMSRATLENIDLYTRYGCMDGFMNNACFVANATPEDQEVVDANNRVITNYGSDMAVYANAPYNLISEIVEINNLFNSNKQTEQE